MEAVALLTFTCLTQSNACFVFFPAQYKILMIPFKHHKDPSEPAVVRYYQINYTYEWILIYI